MCFGVACGCSAGLIAVYVVFASWYIVDQGERAVVQRLGRTVGEARPGPALQGSVGGHGSQDHRAESEPGYQNLEAYSRDQQPANLTVSVTFAVSDASAVYSQYGDLEGAVTAAHRSAADGRRQDDLRSVRRRARHSGTRCAQQRFQLRGDERDLRADQHHQRADREHRLLGDVRAERRAAHARASRNPTARAESTHDGSRGADRAHARRG